MGCTSDLWAVCVKAAWIASKRATSSLSAIHTWHPYFTLELSPLWLFSHWLISCLPPVSNLNVQRGEKLRLDNGTSVATVLHITVLCCYLMPVWYLQMLWQSRKGRHVNIYSSSAETPLGFSQWRTIPCGLLIQHHILLKFKGTMDSILPHLCIIPPCWPLWKQITHNAIENPVCFADSESFMAANTRYENIQLLVLPPRFLQMQNKCSSFGLSWSSRGRWVHTPGGYD